MHKRIAALALLLLIVLQAQAQQSFTCADGQRYLTMLELEISSADALIYASAVGQGTFDPVLHLIEDGQPIACSDHNAIASSISASLPGVGEILPTLNSAQESSSASQRWQLAEYNGGTGAVLLLLEGLLLDAAQAPLAIELSLAQAARVSGAVLHLYAFSETPLAAGDLLLSVPDSPAEEIASEDFAGAYLTIQNTVQLDADEASAGLRLPLEDAPQDLSITLASRSEEGVPVVLALHLSVPERLPQARAFRDVTNALRLDCDGVPQPGAIVEVLLPDQPDLLVTLLMDENGDPLLALINENGNGTCAEDSPVASDYGLLLPEIEFTASPLSAQGLAPAGHVLIVQRSAESKDAIFIVEGLQLSPQGDALRLWLPQDFAQGGEVEAFLIAEEDEGDPLLALVDETGAVLSDALGEPLRCDNASLEDECYESVNLSGVLLTRAEGALLRGLELDARLFAPQEALENGQIYWWLASASEETTSAVLLLRLRFH